MACLLARPHVWQWHRKKHTSYCNTLRWQYDSDTVCRARIKYWRDLHSSSIVRCHQKYAVTPSAKDRLMSTWQFAHQTASNWLYASKLPSDRKAAYQRRVSPLRYALPKLSRAHGTAKKPFHVAYTFAVLAYDDLHEVSDGQSHLALHSQNLGSAHKVIIKFCYVSNITHHTSEYNNVPAEIHQCTKRKTHCPVLCTMLICAVPSCL